MFTLCWDCEKAIGKCPWSRELQPVEGWNAIHTITNNGHVTTEGYLVLDCPLFKRDAYDHGMQHFKEDEYGT